LPREGRADARHHQWGENSSDRAAAADFGGKCICGRSFDEDAGKQVSAMRDQFAMTSRGSCSVAWILGIEVGLVPWTASRILFESEKDDEAVIRKDEPELRGMRRTL
jgi:hypothetical protein